MNENRRQVLEMLSKGQITADEAECLIAALEKEAPGSSSAAGPQPKAKPKYIHVVVNSEDGYHGPATANIRVPMQLLRAGVKFASLIPAQARDHVNDAFREHGVHFDLSQIKPENLEELIDQLNDLTVDVDQKRAKVKVRVFCE
jgi:hypothetical protein